MTVEEMELLGTLKKVVPVENPLVGPTPDVRLTLIRPSADWKILFDFYNKNSGQRRLSLGCMGCYRTVYDYVKNYLIKVIPTNEV